MDIMQGFQYVIGAGVLGVLDKQCVYFILTLFSLDEMGVLLNKDL